MVVVLPSISERPVFMMLPEVDRNSTFSPCTTTLFANSSCSSKGTSVRNSASPIQSSGENNIFLSEDEFLTSDQGPDACRESLLKLVIWEQLIAWSPPTSEIARQF